MIKSKTSKLSATQRAEVLEISKKRDEEIEC
jgi:transposase